MAVAAEQITVRECAERLIALEREHGSDFGAFAPGAEHACRELLRRPDLLHLGVARQGNHTADSAYLYYDGGLFLTVAHFPKGGAVPIHDHGVWQVLGIYRGRMEHVMYERVDDGSTPGHAELRVSDERVLEAGDVISMPPPPHDIHGFTAVDDETYIFAVVPGAYDEIRRYFDPATATYFERSQRGWRTGG